MGTIDQTTIGGRESGEQVQFDRARGRAMKPLTYLLVDFENLQPTAADIERVRADDLRLWIFHGPHQNRFAADMVVAWQPLGDRVQFVQSSRSGKNALDFHIAFHLGVLHERHRAEGSPARFVVVTGDGGFDAIFSHMHTLSAAVGKAKSIPEALTMAESLSLAEPSRPSVTASHPVRVSAPVTDSTDAPSKPRPSRGLIKAAPHLEPKKTLPKKAAAALKPPPAEFVYKVIAQLRAHPKNRPGDRKALERHIISMLGNGVTAHTSQAVASELEQRKIVTYDGKKIAYKLPKATKSPG